MKLPGKARIWFTLTLVIFVGVFILTAVTYPTKARLVPLVIGVPTFVCLLLILLGEWFPLLMQVFDVNLGDLTSSRHPRKGISSEIENGTSAERQKILEFAVFMTGLFLALYIVGWVVAIFVFTFVFGCLVAGMRWWQALLVAVGVDGFVWGIMGKVMGLIFFEGVLRGGIMPPL